MPLSPEFITRLEAAFIANPGPQTDAFFTALAVVSDQDVADIRSWWTTRILASSAPGPVAPVSVPILASSGVGGHIAPRPASPANSSSSEEEIVSDSELDQFEWIVSRSRPGIIRAKRIKPKPTQSKNTSPKK